MHRPPANRPTLLAKWTAFASKIIPEWKRTYFHICSEHFKEDDYVSNYSLQEKLTGATIGYKRLHLDAFPTLYPAKCSQDNSKDGGKSAECEMDSIETLPYRSTLSTIPVPMKLEPINIRPCCTTASVTPTSVMYTNELICKRKAAVQSVTPGASAVKRETSIVPICLNADAVRNEKNSVVRTKSPRRRKNESAAVAKKKSPKRRKNKNVLIAKKQSPMRRKTHIPLQAECVQKPAGACVALDIHTRPKGNNGACVTLTTAMNDCGPTRRKSADLFSTTAYNTVVIRFICIITSMNFKTDHI